MHLNWVSVASKMQSLRHGFAKRITKISPLLTLRSKCRTVYQNTSNVGWVRRDLNGSDNHLMNNPP